MADENKPDWMKEAEKAGWASPDPPPVAAEPPPPPPEPQWMQDARAAGWNPAGVPAPMPAPMPMSMAMAPPAGPPMPPAAPPEQPEPSRNRGWVIAASAACAALVLGVGAAVLLAVSGGDEEAKVLPPAATTAAKAPTTTTVIVREKTPKKKRRNSSNPSSGSTFKPQPSSTINPAASASNAAADRVAVKSVMNRHFQDLVDGNYQRSYNDLTGGLATGASTWIDAQREDGLYEFDLTVSPQVNGSSATAQIVGFTTRAADSGCHTWSGSWQMAKVAGSWKISKSNLSRGDC